MAYLPQFCCWSQIIKHAVNFMLLLWRKLNKVWLQIKLKYTHITVVTMETVLQEIITMQWKSTYCNKGDMGVYSIELFSGGILLVLILMCGIAVSCSPVVYGFASFCLTVFGKRRSFMVLLYHLCALSCLIQVNTMCSMNNSKLNRLIKVNISRL